MSGGSITARAVREAVRSGRWAMMYHARLRSRKRMISDRDVVRALGEAEVLEEYPEGPRGPSALVLGCAEGGRSIHAVCAFDAVGTLLVITKCHLCGGKTEHKLIMAENWWGDELMLVENVPAWVCENCGEAYLDGEVYLELDRMWESPPPLDRRLEVPVYAYRGKKPEIPVAAARRFRRKRSGEACGDPKRARAGR